MRMLRSNFVSALYVAIAKQKAVEQAMGMELESSFLQMLRVTLEAAKSGEVIEIAGEDDET